MDACVTELGFCAKGKVASKACPEKSKAGPKVMEEAAVNFEGSLE
jgi:hypothetical protein